MIIFFQVKKAVGNISTLNWFRIASDDKIMEGYDYVVQKIQMIDNQMHKI